MESTLRTTLFVETFARETFANGGLIRDESLSREIFSKMAVRESLSREILSKFIISHFTKKKENPPL